MKIISRRLLYLLVPLSVLIAFGFQTHMRASVPSRADWFAATEAIRAALQPEDGVTWTPYYAGEGRLFFEDLPAFHMESPEKADFSAYKRVWLLGAFGENADALPKIHSLVERKMFGRVTLDLVQVGGEQTVGSLRQGLEKTSVSYNQKSCDFWDGSGWNCKLRRSPDQVLACLEAPIEEQLREFERNRQYDPVHQRLAPLDCGRDRKLHVSRDTRIVDDFPRRCVWIAPQKNKVMRIDWPEAPAGEWVLDAGLTDAVSVRRSSKQRRLTEKTWVTIAREGGEPQKIAIEPEQAWKRWRGGTPGQGPLIMEWTTDEPEGTEVCFDLTVRAPR